MEEKKELRSEEDLLQEKGKKPCSLLTPGHVTLHVSMTPVCLLQCCYMYHTEGTAGS